MVTFTVSSSCKHLGTLQGAIGFILGKNSHGNNHENWQLHKNSVRTGAPIHVIVAALSVHLVNVQIKVAMHAIQHALEEFAQVLLKL